MFPLQRYNNSKQVLLSAESKFAARREQAAEAELVRLGGKADMKEFMGIAFKATVDVLLPRASSATLVEVALSTLLGRRKMLDPVGNGNEADPERDVEGEAGEDGGGDGGRGGAGLREASSTVTRVSSSSSSNRVNILDLGTGSGCLLLALITGLKRHTSVQQHHTQIVGVGVDISDAALDIARVNATLLGLEGVTSFVKGTFAEHNLGLATTAPFDVVLCNPPYRKRKTARKDLSILVRERDPDEAIYVPGDDELYVNMHTYTFYMGFLFAFAFAFAFAFHFFLSSISSISSFSSSIFSPVFFVFFVFFFFDGCACACTCIHACPCAPLCV